MRNRLSPLVEPVVVMFLGLLLGLVDLKATSASGWLRVPALVAALILVAQSIVTLDAARRGGGRSEVAQEGAADAASKDPGRALHVPAEPEPTPPGHRDGAQLMFFVMGLAVWLGLATLANPGAPVDLLLMSLLASFLLFAEAYKQLRGNS